MVAVFLTLRLLRSLRSWSTSKTAGASLAAAWTVASGGPDCSQNTDANHSNTHSMAEGSPMGKLQTCEQAFQGAQQQLVDDIKSADIPKALHTIEDSYGGGHKGFQLWTHITAGPFIPVDKRVIADNAGRVNGGHIDHVRASPYA
jgi:hypothetical protein